MPTLDDGQSLNAFDYKLARGINTNDGASSPSILKGVPDLVFDLADALLNAAFSLVGLASGTKVIVFGRFADLILDLAAKLLGRALHFILVHGRSPYLEELQLRTR
jgi:hypothetical protein